MRFAFALLALAGCDAVFQLDRDEVPSEAGTDTVVADGDTEICFGSQAGLLQGCLTAAVPVSLAMDAAINTGRTGEQGDCAQIIAQTDLRTTEVCVLAAARIEIQNGVRVVGTRPLVLVATEDIVISGALDASSRPTGLAGAGSHHSTCVASPGLSSANAGGGGGAGGTFGAAGGKGGDAIGASLGGAASLSEPLGFIRGGCDGSKGGDSTVAGGAGGAAGGAIYLIAGSRIQIAGSINVSGEGGDGGIVASGGISSGGGGGGSGGLIGFDAPAIELAATAQLVANGGGGGGGGGTAMAGGNGAYADLASAFSYATAGGGAGVAGGGMGGGGGHQGSQLGVAGTNGTSGAGGGGGGVGIIRVFGGIVSDAGAKITPARS